MTDEPTQPRNKHDVARQDRLARALRDNLKRRKSQSRGRADVPSAPDADAAQAERSRQDGSDVD